MSQINEKDVFETITQVFDKFHQNVERTNPQYLQSLTNFQQEYMKLGKILSILVSPPNKNMPKKQALKS